MWRDKSKKDINIIRTFMILDDDDDDEYDSKRNNDAMMMLMITRVSSKR